MFVAMPAFFAVSTICRRCNSVALALLQRGGTGRMSTLHSTTGGRPI